jgi:hypothetical protein
VTGQVYQHVAMLHQSLLHNRSVAGFRRTRASGGAFCVLGSIPRG